VPWTEAQKEAFLRMQFRAQSLDYAANYAGTEFLIIPVDGVPGGRLCVDRRDDELHIVDIALLPEHRGAAVGGAILHGVVPLGWLSPLIGRLATAGEPPCASAPPFIALSILFPRRT
jgi:hypothetical protein